VKNGKVKCKSKSKMQNEEAIIFINKTKTEKEMDRIEENPSLQIESNKILGVNEEKSKQILEQ
jgi:hypothetical protein